MTCNLSVVMKIDNPTTKVGPARDVRRNEVSATRLHRCVAAVLAIRDTAPEFAILAEA